MALTIITLYLIASVVAAFLAVVLTQKKNRSYVGWCIWSLIFPPLVLLLFLVPKRKRPAKKISQDDLDKEDRLRGWLLP